MCHLPRRSASAIRIFSVTSRDVPPKGCARPCHVRFVSGERAHRAQQRMAVLYGGGERAKLAVSKGTVVWVGSFKQTNKKDKKKGSFSRERENGEEVPDCSCFSSHEKIAGWQRIKYSKL